MEIEIKEKIDSLEITKNCKHELRKNSAIAFCIIILVYSVFIYNNPFFFFIPLFTCHFAFLFYIFMCREYKYERISINFKELAIKEIEIIEYHKFFLKEIFLKNKLEEKFAYVISFIFSDNKILNFAYGMEKDEAKRLVRRIETFLEKQKIYS